MKQTEDSDVRIYFRGRPALSGSIRQFSEETVQPELQISAPSGIMAILRQQLEQGVIAPNVMNTLTLEEAPAAVKALEAGSTT